jgi:restriction endonuclease Mrr
VGTTEDRAAVRKRCREATLEALRQLGGSARREQIRERALEIARFTAAELAWPAPEAGREKYNTLVEHQLSWALTDLKRKGLVENPARGTWRLAGAVEPSAPLGPAVSLERLRELRQMPYRHYLKTPEWQRIRERALKRAQQRCQLDASHEGTLNVHHSSYARLGAEESADLVVLCDACHRRHHQTNGRPRRLDPVAPVSVPAPGALTPPGAVEVADVERTGVLRRTLRNLLS